MAFKIIGVTACPTGVAHTYMAAEAISNSAKDKGWDVTVETQGSMGIDNQLPEELISTADMVILSNDRDCKIFCVNASGYM